MEGWERGKAKKLKKEGKTNKQTSKKQNQQTKKFQI
jgi:hypothetical protein